MHEPENYENTRNARSDTFLDELISVLLEKMRMGSQRGQRILDFGCGTGSRAFKDFLPIAEQCESTILGLDVSEEMIRYSREHFATESLTFKCGNIMDDEFDLGESNFDSIISILVLHFIKDYRKALQKLFELLKPGGKCALVVAASADQFPSYKLLGQEPKWAPYMRGYEEYLPDWTESANSGEMAKTLIGEAAEKSGFNVIELELQILHSTFHSFNVYIEFLLSLNPFIHNIPQELRSELHSTLRTHFCNKLDLSDAPAIHEKEFIASPELLLVIIERPSL